MLRLKSGSLTEQVQVLVYFLIIKSVDRDVNWVDSIGLHYELGSLVHRFAPGVLCTNGGGHISTSNISWLLLIFDHLMQFLAF